MCSQLVESPFKTGAFSTKRKPSTEHEQPMNNVMNDFSTCLHFSLCSGCSLDKNFFNPPIKQQILSYFDGLGAPLSFRSTGFASTRWKAKLAIRGSFDNPQIGLFKRNSHEVVSIPRCLVHHPSINRGVEILRDAVRAHRIPPYSESPPSGLLRYAQLFVERSSGRVQLSLSLNAAEIPPILAPFFENLAKSSLWHSIWVNCNPGSTNRIFSDDWRQISGESWLWQKFGKAEAAYHPAAFAQAHLPLFEEMLKLIREWVPQNSRCLELFAGTGAISLFLSDRCQALDLVENNPFSALSFQQSLQRTNKNLFSYRLGDAKVQPGPYDVVIVDPPRKGLGAQLIQTLDAEILIYVSCSFDSFRRDSDLLSENGWKLEKGAGFFLFPGTNEIEIAACFKKLAGSAPAID